MVVVMKEREPGSNQGVSWFSTNSQGSGFLLVWAYFLVPKRDNGSCHFLTQSDPPELFSALETVHVGSSRGPGFSLFIYLFFQDSV